MASTEFCIKWTNYQTNILNSVGKLRNEDEFVDVTLVCEDQNIMAHKVILSACSDYFKQIFKTTPSSQHMVLLPNIQHEDMMSLVQYMYTGQVFIHQDMLGRLLKTAQQLQVKGLIEQSGCSRAEESQTSSDQPQPSTSISSASPLLLSPFQQLTPPPSVSPSSSSSSLPSPGKPTFQPIKIPSPPNSSFSWNKPGFSSPLSQQKGGSLFPGGETAGKTWTKPAQINDDIKDEDSHNNNNHDDGSDDELVIDTQGDSKEIVVKEDHIQLEGSPNFGQSTGVEEVRDERGGQGQVGTVTSSSSANNVTHPRQRWRCMQPRLCNYCWKTFSNSFNLKQHIVNVHIQSQGVNCNICDKVVKNKWYLRKHLVTAHGAPLKRSKNSDNSNTSSLESSSMTVEPMDSSILSSLNAEPTALTMTN